MKKLLTIAGYSVTLVAVAAIYAFGAGTTSQLTTEINTNLPDNTTGAITPAILRTTLIDIINSYFNTVGPVPLAINNYVSITTPFAAVSTQTLSVLSLGSTENVNGQDYSYALFQVNNDSANPGAFNSTYGLNSTMFLGAAQVSGNKTALSALLGIHNGAGASNTGGDYNGLSAVCDATVPNGGTSGSRAGDCYGASINGNLRGTATNYSVVAGAEIDAVMRDSSSANHRWGISTVSLGTATGTLSDAGFELGHNAGPAYRTALLLDSFHGLAPLDSTAGCVVCTDGVAATIASGIDLSPWTLVATGNLLAGPNGLRIDGSGGVQTGITTIASLATCNATNNQAKHIAVSNGIASPTYHQAVSATGSTLQPIFCQGAGGWVYD